MHVTSGDMAVYGPVRHQNKYYVDLRSFGPYNMFLVTDRSIYCHMTLSAMNYLLYTKMKTTIMLRFIENAFEMTTY